MAASPAVPRRTLGRAGRWIVHVMGGGMESEGAVDWANHGLERARFCPDPCFGVSQSAFGTGLPGLSDTRV
jgi:hypothetical protein